MHIRQCQCGRFLSPQNFPLCNAHQYMQSDRLPLGGSWWQWWQRWERYPHPNAPLLVSNPCPAWEPQGPSQTAAWQTETRLSYSYQVPLDPFWTQQCQEPMWFIPAALLCSLALGPARGFRPSLRGVVACPSLSLHPAAPRQNSLLEGNINCPKIGSGSFEDIFLVIDLTSGEEVASLCCRRGNWKILQGVVGIPHIRGHGQ